ncbi:polysaccharide pyruvyl transferase family protein [Sphingobium sp. CR28]|uniref:polysaccharide pyruvyl transferase family protein n=1 Tax=Sphingobium sp. CR28 TaxID=3400272 RepID=UPI003FF133C2
MKHVTITNMTGARNGGCEALVRSIIDGLVATCGEGAIDISIDSNDPEYDAYVFRDRVSRVTKIAGLPSSGWSVNAQRRFFNMPSPLLKLASRGHYRSIDSLRKSDLLIATGGDVFTSDYNGFPRHARTLQVGTPVALLAQTLGPFAPSDAERFRRSMDNIALCTVRESETLDYLKSEFPDLPVEQTADVAFLLSVTAPDEARRILEEEHHFSIEGRKLVGLSISSGILSYRKDLSPEQYLNEVAGFVDDLNGRGYSVIVIPHVQERSHRNNDVYACREVLRRVQKPKENLLLALSTLSASDYKGVIGLCEVLLGARTHATIASMSQGIPTVSIAYSRKAWGIMRDYYGKELGERLTMDVSALNRERLMDAFDAALANGRTETVAADMKRRAQINFDRVKAFLAKG